MKQGSTSYRRNIQQFPSNPMAAFSVAVFEGAPVFCLRHTNRHEVPDGLHPTDVNRGLNSVRYPAVASARRCLTRQAPRGDWETSLPTAVRQPSKSEDEPPSTYSLEHDRRQSREMRSTPITPHRYPQYADTKPPPMTDTHHSPFVALIPQAQPCPDEPGCPTIQAIAVTARFRQR